MPDRRIATRTYMSPLLEGQARWQYGFWIVLWAAAAVWFWHWWLQPEHTSGPQYWVATVALGWLFFLQSLFILIFLRARVPTAEPPDPATTRVAMIVTKTPSEPFSVLKTTLEAMLAQTYPHDTWLADEAPTPETIAWCDAHGVRISTRQNRPDYHRQEWPRRTRCKEGNLAYFYDHFGYESYDFVSQLDADHVPSPTYLHEVMRGFADPDVGYVSAPSICARNAKESWAARTRMYNEAVFHGVFQSGYAGVLTPMCIGSHYAVRTKALRAVGGLGPELAEDHSTTMLMAAGGWRGVHAFRAIAYGDGPANLTDLCTQEFQWSRSLLTIFLSYTGRFFKDLSPRNRFLFLFCQLFYPLFAGFMALLYILAPLALIFDIRYAEVTFPEFFIHAIVPMLMLTGLIYKLKVDGHLRPVDAKIISWEKALFLGIQWPWVFWGCVMALRDRFAGGFVDFRITPKGEAAQAILPMRLILVYSILALGCLLPVLLVENVLTAHGFYLLSTINGIFYTAIVAVTVFHHYKATDLMRAGLRSLDLVKIVLPLALMTTTATALNVRGMESVYALSKGLGPYRLIREQYPVAGAGLGQPGTVILKFDPGRIRYGSDKLME